MAWVLKEPSRPRWQFEELHRTGGTVYRDPHDCSHTRRRWRGGFHWDCIDCGEPVRDREDKTQTTFDRLFIKEQECLHTETFRVSGNVADPALEGQLRCRQCHRPLED
jgi:hypothetical protein